VRLLPRSFFGRNLLLLTALFAFGLGCGVLALREWAQKPRITELAELVAQQIRLAQLNLELVPEEQRALLRSWLNSRSAMQVLPLAAADPPAATPNPALAARRQFIRDLRSRLPGVRDVRWTPLDRGTVWVQLSVGQQPYWFTENGIYLETSVSGTGIVVFVLVTLLSVFGAFQIQRRINRPLARLVAAARALESNQRMTALDESGPHEFAVVSRAFNRMTASLEKMDAERAVLLAGVSHDLRTPLAKMRLAIEMLRGSADPELVQSMQRSAAEMATVTDQFLYYARDREPRELVEMDLNNLLMHSVERHRGGSRAIRFRPVRECLVAVHRDSISRAVDNLVENALRYSESDVEVTLDVLDGYARISVLDRGPGIPAAELESVRKPFARGSSGAGKQGAGLGLAIVERIAAWHGAKLDLRARAGGGTEARLELPLAAGASAARASSRLVSDSAGTAHGR
jgi:two-component system, OmpR family, osmolarity sensor histidine kinase EnvZ